MHNHARLHASHPCVRVPVPGHTARERGLDAAVDPDVDCAGGGVDGAVGISGGWGNMELVEGNLHEIDFSVAVYIGPAVLGAVEALADFDLVWNRGGHGLQLVGFVEPACAAAVGIHADVLLPQERVSIRSPGGCRKDIEKVSTYVYPPVAIQVTESYGEIEQLAIGVRLRAKRVIDDLHWGVEGRECCTLLVGVAEQVDVTGFPVDG
jgi:hypothetical protein